MQEQQVTMTVQVPISLRDAFLARVKEEKMPPAHIVLELMQSYSKRINIDEQERATRINHMKKSLANMHLEGEEITEFAQLIANMYCDGKITMEERFKLLQLYHGYKNNNGNIK
jgi:hypothetical protein